jgi:hypothetical protein
LEPESSLPTKNGAPIRIPTSDAAVHKSSGRRATAPAAAAAAWPAAAASSAGATAASAPAAGFIFTSGPGQQIGVY